MNYLSFLSFISSFFSNKTNIIRVVLVLIVLAFSTYFYFDYKSLKEDKINLNKSLSIKEEKIKELYNVINGFEIEKKELETYYELQLSKQKSVINIIQENNKQSEKEIKTVIKKVLEVKTTDEKKNLKNLLDILRNGGVEK